MKHFTMNELTQSPTADCMKIENTPNASQREALTELVEQVLDPLREAFGYPIYVNSGYRCAQLNKAVGGAKNSQHMDGKAVDITAGEPDANRRMFKMLKKMQLPVDQVINEGNYTWLHVSHDRCNRGQYLKG